MLEKQYARQLMLATVPLILPRTTAMKGVGKGIWNSDIERSDIFLTTKLPTAVKDYEGTKEAIDEALDRFGLKYIDLLLIHSPQNLGLK